MASRILRAAAIVAAIVGISGASGIVADDKGTIYAADVGPHRLRKYVKIK